MLLLRWSRRRAGVVLVYHGLADRSGDPESELVAPHSAGLFEHQLGYVARVFRLVPAADVQTVAAARRRGERLPAAITFDDDLSSHMHVALPLLQRARVPATFFLTGASLEAPAPFWWQRLEAAVKADPGRLPAMFAAAGAPDGDGGLLGLAQRVERLEPNARGAFEAMIEGVDGDFDPGLSAEDVLGLVEGGMEIGFHTRGHHCLPGLSDEELAAAFHDGRDELERLTGRPLATIAYPHGAADSRVARAARAAGFDAGFTGTARAVRANDDPLLLGRIDPSHSSVAELSVQLAAALLRSDG